MISSLLITLREGLEASLIVAIVLSYLVRTGNRNKFRNVWLGIITALFISIAAGVLVFTTAGELSEAGEELFEGMAMILAVGVLTWMIFWMRKVSRNIRIELEQKIDEALEVGTPLAIAFLVFVAVVREGLETVLFLFSATRMSTPIGALAGGMIGLVIAVLIGYSTYRGTQKLNLQSFFKITGLILILFAAGLLAQGIHELQEIGIAPVLKENVWDINHVLDERGVMGSFLKSLFGYNANPSLVEILSYFAYLGWALLFYLKEKNNGS